jgi:hypothetical protein
VGRHRNIQCLRFVQTLVSVGSHTNPIIFSPITPTLPCLHATPSYVARRWAAVVVLLRCARAAPRPVGMLLAGGYRRLKSPKNIGYFKKNVATISKMLTKPTFLKKIVGTFF